MKIRSKICSLLDSVNVKGRKMKYRIRFVAEERIILPIQYKHVIQAAFLKWIGEGDYTDFIHSTGYVMGKRNYKLYTISDILSQGKKAGSQLLFDKKIEILISSCMGKMDELILNAIQEDKVFVLGKRELFVDEYENIEEAYDECVVRTVSPVTIHSTFELPGGRKKTYYYSVNDLEFSNMIKENLIRKYKSIYGVVPEDDNFHIVPMDKSKIRKMIVNYKSTVIVGWKADFKLTGNPEMIRIALLAGIGARNSIGMGMLLQV